jgi:hypothetical protein
MKMMEGGSLSGTMTSKPIDKEGQRSAVRLRSTPLSGYKKPERWNAMELS